MAQEPETEVVTLAALRTPEAGEHTQVLFNELHRIYTIPHEGRTAERSLGLLREAAGSPRPLRVTVDPVKGAVRRVEVPTEAEVARFERGRGVLEKPEKSYAVDLDRIDPTRFNVVDHHLKVPVFRLCKRIVPSYTKAKEIFDFCAAQSCHLGGPFDVSPCIPFQYVIDGCYARAHKMRWIITTRFRYCCEKVFSYATDDFDTLAVQANKWGGCCVTWWYHVAPLIRVRVRLGKASVVLAMVVDPGMFDKPVLLSSWLYAQENKTCSANAKVSSWSIQPGSAYTPSFPPGSYATDDAYTATDAKLNQYHALVTCP